MKQLDTKDGDGEEEGSNGELVSKDTKEMVRRLFEGS
jgi:hypothetical protein